MPHIPFAFWLIDALRPRTVVELGTHTGVSYSAFAQAVQMLGLDTATYAVDTWKGDHQAGFYDEDVFKEWSSFHDHHFSAFSRLVRSTFEEALSKFPDGSVDLLHIDGVHTYEAVRQDFESWFPKLSNRAVVLMHDTNVREADFGVWRFWAEVAARVSKLRLSPRARLGRCRGWPQPARRCAVARRARQQSWADCVHRPRVLRHAWRGLLRQLRESAQAHERAQMVGRLAEQDALVARLTAEATQVSARQAENEAALRQLVHAARGADRAPPSAVRTRWSASRSDACAHRCTRTRRTDVHDDDGAGLAAGGLRSGREQSRRCARSAHRPLTRARGPPRGHAHGPAQRRTRSATVRKDCRTRLRGCSDGSIVPTNVAPR